ncbi:hypothetical protein [Komagataeibacter oboediens]|uniref:hypothetical protein n=1 Tax=Komagataeibacter oboediens TaxID=65958 RepID=UPI000237F3B6|nr:hypothetical protein [Komagataeibacter oboediens]
MMRRLVFMMGLLAATPAWAQDADVTPKTACPLPKNGWPTRPGFTCANLDQATITSLEGVTRKQVQEILKAPGDCSPDGAMCHYDDWNVRGGSYYGEVTVYYDAVGGTHRVKAHAEQALKSPFSAGYFMSDQPNPAFDVVWDNISDDASCSDFTGQPQRCN